MEDSNKMIGIVVAILVSVIIVGVVFAIVSFSNSAKESAMDDLAAAMGQMDQAAFDRFENGTMSGSNVASALTEMKGKPIIFIVQTASGSARNYLATANGGAKTAVPGTDGGSSITWDGDFAAPPAGPFTLDPDWSNTLNYNTDFSPTKNSASQDFIKLTARFNTVLMYDANEQIVGIFASQI